MTTSERWVALARKQAEEKMGKAKSLFTPEVRNALACAELVAIFASQEVANGEKMREACELLMASEES